MNGLLKRTSSVSFYPTGTVIRLLPGPAQYAGVPNRVPLDDLWDHYLAPTLSGQGSFEPGLNPINGLMAELCAHPYLNMVKFLRLKNDYSKWDAYPGIASALIQDNRWIGDIWSEKAAIDESLGRKKEAMAGYALATMAYQDAGDFQKCVEMNTHYSKLEDQLNPKIKNPAPQKRGRVH